MDARDNGKGGGLDNSSLESALDGIFVMLDQMQQGFVEMGKTVNSNRVHNLIFSRIMMTKINEVIVSTGIDVDLIDRQTFADTLDEYKAIRRLEDYSECLDAWLDGKDIPKDTIDRSFVDSKEDRGSISAN